MPPLRNWLRPFKLCASAPRHLPPVAAESAAVGTARDLAWLLACEALADSGVIRRVFFFVHVGPQERFARAKDVGFGEWCLAPLILREEVAAE